MLNEDEYDEFRRRVIERYDVYDLVELLGLRVEDWLDNTTGWEDNQELREACGIDTSSDEE